MIAFGRTKLTKVSIFLPSFRIGGAERMAVNLANELSSLGLDLELVVAKSTGLLLNEVSDDVSVWDLKFNLDRFPLPFSFVKLSLYLSEENPDTILSLMKHANITVNLAAIFSSWNSRIILSERNHLSQALSQEPYLKRAFITKLMKNLYPKSDHIIAISEGVAKDLHDVIGINSEDITVIYNPVVTDNLLDKAKENVNHKWFCSNSINVILSVGRLHPQKNFKTLLRAFAEVRTKQDCRLVLLGEGDQRAKLEKLANKLCISDSVYMPGKVKNPYKYMARSDVFVLSSDWEGFGNVIVEALACGCPVVSTDCPSGPREILNNGKYGDLVPVGDEVALADSIIDMLEDPTDPEILTSRSNKFKVGNIALDYLKVIRGQ